MTESSLMESTLNIVERLAKDLPTVDVQRAVQLVTQLGMHNAGRVLGYDVSHYNNLLMAGRLAIENLKMNAPKTLLEYAQLMKERLNKPTYNFIIEHHEVLQSAIDKNSYLDYDHDWFSANTMIKMYSANLKYGEPAVETPQYTWMRIAVQLYHKVSVDEVIRVYEELAVGWYTPASPTIFNAGMKNPQMSSCFLLSVNDDLDNILETGVHRVGMISKSSGGIGLDISNVRHSEIGSTGFSNGIIPMLGMINNTVRYVDQGGRRKGAATIFLRPHHIDIEDFINLPLKVGDKYMRAHDLNICLWTSWIFWERVRNNGKWTVFCPARTPQLNDLSGVEFTKAYLAAEEDPTIAPHHKKVINARDLYDKILNVQRETGMPYLMNGDAANIKSNHRHLGYIRSSNLCLEIVEYTDDKTIAVCNLHSLSLRMYGSKPSSPISEDAPEDQVMGQLRQAVDFKQLSDMSRRVTKNLNNVIDHNWYPLDKVKDGVLKPKIINKSNKKHRPVGMGVSGFAELLHILDLPFEHSAVTVLNKMVFACMYWNALAQSVQLAINEGPYESFQGSPTSQGKLQFDLWKEEFQILGPNAVRKKEDDEPLDPVSWGQECLQLYAPDGVTVQDVIQPTWDDLKRCIVKYGLRNSLLIALMPTATTAQVRRNCESVEAHQNNMYSRNVLKASYPVLTRHLVEDLEAEGVWNVSAVEYIRVRNGSVQGFTQFVTGNPELFPGFSGNKDRLTFLEKKYKTMWEIPQKRFMKLAADRSRYIDQSCSTNVFIRDCTDDKLRACHLYANQLGLKTIQYYLRQKGGETIKFTADPTLMKYIEGLKVEGLDQEKSASPSVAKKEQGDEKPKKKFVCTDEICVSCT